MATDDGLRDKLTKTLAERAYYRYPGDQIDALMPVVREALADAWDHGHRTANPVIPDTHRDVINPWKQP